MDNDKSFLIESCGGNKVIPAGEIYNMPSVLITFPKDEWDGISLFRQKLIDFGLYTPKKKPFSQIPAWWEKPDLSSGENAYKAYDAINEEWVRDFVNKAEKDWGFKNINLIIDDAWQLPHSFEPAVATDRFPDIRKFIGDMHRKGHHVLLWQTSMFDVVSNGFMTRAQRLGVLSDYRYAGENDPGEVYSFKNEDDNTSIDRNFTEARDVTSETEMNYVNN